MVGPLQLHCINMVGTGPRVLKESTMSRHNMVHTPSNAHSLKRRAENSVQHRRLREGGGRLASSGEGLFASKLYYTLNMLYLLTLLERASKEKQTRIIGWDVRERMWFLFVAKSNF